MDERGARNTSMLAWLVFLIGFGLPISTAAGNIATGLFLVAWLATGDWHARWQRLRDNPAFLGVLALLLLAALGMAWSLGSAKETWRYFEKYASLILTLCLFTVPMGKALRQRALMGFVSATVVTALVSFGFKFGIVPAAWFPDRVPSNPAIFKLHITHGFFVAIGAYILLIRALEATDRRWKAGFALAALLTAANALAIEGRTGYLVLAVLTVFLFIQRFRWRGVAASLAILLLSGVVAQQFPESAAMRRMATAVDELRGWQRGERDDFSSMGVRLRFATTSLQLIAERPLLGVGTGGYEVAYRAAVPEGDLVTNNPHNQYLLTTVQLGFVGLAVLLGVFGWLWRLSARLISDERLIARGVLLAYLVGNVFNSFLYDHSEARFFAWAVGIAFCGVTAARRTESVG